MFDAFSRIGLIEVPPLVLRYGNGVQVTKIGVAMLIEEEMAALLSLLLFEIKLWAIKP